MAFKLFGFIPPSRVIRPGSGPNGEDYLSQWFIVRLPRQLGGVSLHRFGCSDGAEPHDHPWDNCSIILWRRYIEWVGYPACNGMPGSDSPHIRKPGNIVFRKAETPHRVSLGLNGNPVWTLFFYGPNRRSWGFWCPKGWTSSKEFCRADDDTKVGRGCG